MWNALDTDSFHKDIQSQTKKNHFKLLNQVVRLQPQKVLTNYLYLFDWYSLIMCVSSSINFCKSLMVQL